MTTAQTVAVTDIYHIPLRNAKSTNKNIREAKLSDGSLLSISYRTVVAAFVPSQGYMRTARKWSVTTTKHINSWLDRQDAANVAEVEQDVLDALLPAGCCL